MKPAARRARRSSGFTLVELVVTMVLISIAVLGLSQALAFAFIHQSDGLWQAKSVALAEAYIEEIMARRYDEVTPPGGVPPCGPASVPCTAAGSEGETRAQFDDVDDYDGLDEQPPLDADGNPRGQYAAYRVQVSVDYADATLVAALALDDASDAKIVVVDVTPPGQATMSFPVVRGNY